MSKLFRSILIDSDGLFAPEIGISINLSEPVGPSILKATLGTSPL